MWKGDENGDQMTMMWMYLTDLWLVFNVWTTVKWYQISYGIRSHLYTKQSDGHELQNKKVWALIQFNYQYAGNILGLVNMMGIEKQLNVCLLLETPR